MDKGLISLIYKYLSVKEMLKASLTCKLWRRSLQWVKKSFKPIKVYGSLNYDWVNEIDFPQHIHADALVKFRHCDKVTLYIDWNIDLRNLFVKNVFLNDSKVKSLNIVGRYGEYEISSKMFTYCYYLDCLELTHLYIEISHDIFKYFRNLKRLEITNCEIGFDYQTGEDFEIFSNLENLEELVFLVNEDHYSSRYLGFKHLKNCKYLEFKGILNRKDEQYVEKIQHFIINSYDVSDEFHEKYYVKTNVYSNGHKRRLDSL